MTAEPEEQRTRLDRRKERTRRALIEAAQRILAERGTDVSIQEITETADVGFGSFYNHFASKSELFEVAVGEILEEYGAALDKASADLTDSAEIYAVGVRMTARLALTRRAVAQVLLQVGLSYAAEDRGLAHRALRDIRQGVADGRFTIENARLGVITTAGCLLAFLQTALEPTSELDESDADALAEMLLRMLGMTARSAAAVARRPLPAIPV
ncbi:TetR/AcrR family transcriptional regulator [Cellulomonas sp. ICMP 17802]|uniref:TetR/AcrR family transcriptional regulator n=1 Tax=Cellulomonas sp. ICMP 17802 TaxID=3239199 RepID=UPI00351B3B45